jgi:hypothetical protein
MSASRTRRLIAAVALLVLAFAGLASAETVEDETTYFLAWEGCGAETQTFLSLDAPARNGCGTIGGAPLAEALALSGSPQVRTYASRGGVQGQTLDATRNLVGEIHAHSWSGATGAGVGQVVVNGTLAVRYLPAAGGQARTVSLPFSGDGTATPSARSVRVPFDLDLPDAADRGIVQSVSLDLEIRGAHVDSGVQAGGGLSKLVLPHVVAAP